MRSSRFDRPVVEEQTSVKQPETTHAATQSQHRTAGSADADSAIVREFAWNDSDSADTANNCSGNSAAHILRTAADVIEQRAILRDLPNGQRSMARAVQSYNALTGSSLSELDGWIFMCALKLARATAGAPHLDDFTDLAGYAALAGEGIAP